MVEFQYGAATDVGLVRETNQDAHLASPHVFVVADGMGGHQGGDIASGIVVDEFARLARDGYDINHAADVVSERLAACQRRIHEYAEQHRGGGDPHWYAGTTVVAALLCADKGRLKWLLVNLGDSRIYRFGGGRLDQVTVDHSVVQELLDAGEIDADQAATHPDRNVITRALGGGSLPEPDFFVLPFASARRLLLCSDGISGMLDDAAIAEFLRACRDPREAASRLVADAVAAGGEDNATAVVVDVVGWRSVSLEQKLGALP